MHHFNIRPSEYTRSTCSLNKWVRSLVGIITSSGTGEYFPPLQFTCRNCGGGDRGRVAIYRPFGEFRRAKIALSPVWCSRPTTGVPLAHATMNFVGLDLTTSDRKTDWCALWAGGIIGAYFFKNDEGHNVTVNGDRYRAMITNFFIPELNNHDVQELWFQQDGAICHTARATIDLLKDTFGDRLISRFGPVNWPPRSCDLTPLDYFL
ncbi:transposable element Tc3 transposase [Trichonephila clavipes]|nr:transposable element Tc3 transposase [Trichonephila clavipes]